MSRCVKDFTGSGWVPGRVLLKSAMCFEFHTKKWSISGPPTRKGACMRRLRWRLSGLQITVYCRDDDLKACGKFSLAPGTQFLFIYLFIYLSIYLFIYLFILPHQRLYIVRNMCMYTYNISICVQSVYELPLLANNSVG